MQVLNIFHVLIAIAMIAFILIQKGAGATAGAAFGSGASGTVFGSRGASSFLSRSTWVLATLFCLISLSMAIIASRASLAPETDLGVVATSPVIEETGGQTVPGVATDLPGAELTGTDLPGDLPVGGESVDSPGPTTMESSAAETAGDLPVIEADAETGSADEDSTTGDDT
jgi:preprotein translocase subunit SecG